MVAMFSLCVNLNKSYEKSCCLIHHFKTLGNYRFITIQTLIYYFFLCYRILLVRRTRTSCFCFIYYQCPVSKLLYIVFLCWRICTPHFSFIDFVLSYVNLCIMCCLFLSQLKSAFCNPNQRGSTWTSPSIT